MLKCQRGSYFILGHEATGVVCKVGADVKDIKVGAKIAIENHFYCGNCYSCDVSLLFVLELGKLYQWPSHLYLCTGF